MKRGIDELKKAAKKKAAKKKAPKKKAPKNAQMKSQTVAPTSSELAAAINKAEMARFVRAFSRSGFDKLQAVYEIHPELKNGEVAKMANRYLGDPLFQVEMTDFMRQDMERMRIDQDEAEEILSRQATTSVLDFFSDAGELKSMEELRRMPRHKQAALRKIKVTNTRNVSSDGDVEERQTIEVETYDIQKALALLAKFRGWGYDDDESAGWGEMLKRAERRLQERTIDVTPTEVYRD